MVLHNAENIRLRIAAACRRAGRDPAGVTLVAVAKTFGSDRVREALSAGIRDIGENFVQELVRKRRDVNEEAVRWHFVGHLQTNKVRHIIEWIHLIHSVDSVRLGSEISKRAAAAGRAADILVEINSTGEGTKFGVQPQMAFDLIRQLNALPNLNVRGLMTLGPAYSDPEQARPSFRLMRELKEELESRSFSVPELSMGMTGDYEVAVEEGATIVRVGTGLFGARKADAVPAPGEE
jgi:pyridoxal phosphate enzyme (YggS family)